MENWHYVRNGQQVGPVPLETLRQMAATGQLQPGDLVWTPGMGNNWQAAASVGGIFAPGAMPPVATIPYATPGQTPPGPGIGDDPAARWLLPVGRSGWAIAAGYLGLISVLVLPAPLALICSIIAIRDIRSHPNRHGMGRAVFGLIMGIIFSLVLCGVLFNMLSRW